MEIFKKYIVSGVFWVFTYFYPTIEFILMIGLFVGADTVTGVMAAIKNGEEVTSKKFRAVFPKFIVYGTAIIVSFVLQKHFFPDFPGMKIVSGLIAYSELLSIDENIQKVTGVSLFKFFINKLKK